MSLYEGGRGGIAGNRSADGDGGGGGDKFSAVHGDGLLTHGNQVTVGANVHALMCDGRGGVAAFIKIIDGEDFEFSISSHHDGFAV